MQKEDYALSINIGATIGGGDRGACYKVKPLRAREEPFGLFLLNVVSYLFLREVVVYQVVWKVRENLLRLSIYSAFVELDVIFAKEADEIYLIVNEGGGLKVSVYISLYSGVVLQIGDAVVLIALVVASMYFAFEEVEGVVGTRPLGLEVSEIGEALRHYFVRVRQSLRGDIALYLGHSTEEDGAKVHIRADGEENGGDAEYRHKA